MGSNLAVHSVQEWVSKHQFVTYYLKKTLKIILNSVLQFVWQDERLCFFFQELVFVILNIYQAFTPFAWWYILLMWRERMTIDRKARLTHQEAFLVWVWVNFHIILQKETITWTWRWGRTEKIKVYTSLLTAVTVHQQFESRVTASDRYLVHVSCTSWCNNLVVFYVKL